jgi:hypothetical protein
MDDIRLVWRVLLLVIAAIGIGVAIFRYTRVLKEIQKSDLDPAERKKWLRRVLLLRGIGWIQWEQFRREHGATTRTGDPERDGLNDAPPPGSD